MCGENDMAFVDAANPDSDFTENALEFRLDVVQLVVHFLSLLLGLVKSRLNALSLIPKLGSCLEAKRSLRLDDRLTILQAVKEILSLSLHLLHFVSLSLHFLVNVPLST